MWRHLAARGHGPMASVAAGIEDPRQVAAEEG